MDRSRRARWGAWLALVVPAVLLPALVVLAPPAAAHTSLRSTTPADGAKLTAAPADVRLDFDGELVAMGTQVVVDGPGGTVPLEPPAVERSSVTQPLPDGLGVGSYAVTWRTTAADGHPISGRLAFTVSGAAPSDPPPSDPVAAVGGGLSTPAALALGGGVLAALVGALVALLSRRPPGQD